MKSLNRNILIRSLYRNAYRSLSILAILAAPVLLTACGSGGDHHWAWAEQQVDNHGGDSRLNLWKPDSDPGVFSLSQHWYVAGDGNEKQTVEGGWQVYPGKYNTQNPVLFIYRTPDNYSSGCYNLDCAGFVQINNSWVLGGSLTPQSTDGGTQYIIRMQWQLVDKNWWLFVQGSGDYIAVGYYPESVFSSGPITDHAEYVKYGGETVENGSGLAGEMGSGNFASTGWSHAAYQRTVYYINTSQVSQWTNMTAHQPSASCYTIDLNNSTGGSWVNRLYFGGPGCP